ncbi:Uu.00g032430.m01.CDS01 [Anthostomella pinea]|uniref:Uu.00g032430.m01.CDS01 n=1 Tax=Anthostomella pinea TaxID=933095 RepID=A0AAI8V8P4_9PEZI|nr:Uu.00g032430.m01.CDS01 [Anthostomella pinea]
MSYTHGQDAKQVYSSGHQLVADLGMMGHETVFGEQEVALLQENEEAHRVEDEAERRRLREEEAALERENEINALTMALDLPAPASRSLSTRTPMQAFTIASLPPAGVGHPSRKVPNRVPHVAEVHSQLDRNLGVL